MHSRPFYPPPSRQLLAAAQYPRQSSSNRRQLSGCLFTNLGTHQARLGTWPVFADRCASVVLGGERLGISGGLILVYQEETHGNQLVV